MEEDGGGTAGGARVPPTPHPGSFLAGWRACRSHPGGWGGAPLLALAAAQLAAAAGAVLQRGLEPQPGRQRQAVRRRQRRPHRAAHDSRGQPHPRSESEHVLSPRRRYTGSGGHGDGPPAVMGRVRPEGAAVLRLLQGGGERVAAGELPHPEVHHLLPRGLVHPRVPLARRRLPRTASQFVVKPPPSFNFSSTRSASSFFFPSASRLLDVFSSPVCVLLLCSADKARGQGRAREPGSGGGAGSPGPQSPRLAWHPGMADSQPGGWLLASFRVPRRPGSGEGAARGPVRPASSPERRPDVKIKVSHEKQASILAQRRDGTEAERASPRAAAALRSPAPKCSATPRCSSHRSPGRRPRW